ncbi:hypothetical protein UVI_02000400 [Ustilaginoidea virens]|uniref:Uncharacterized protein n=1 Tax=Ustilaginoidea virens TaxID=1159556 RepID=A0A1B5KYT6_USTVR|nr:hypothetical protein UVI_02000400 [Ustilaginoidea virens]
MFAASTRRLAQAAKESVAKAAQSAIASNPYKARKVWPPDFKELNHAQQLRFEKKYKRRVLLAGRSPRWEKGVKLAQLATIAGKAQHRHVETCPFGRRGSPTVTAALVWLLFYSEFEWWGKQYKPSEEVFASLAPFSLLPKPSARAYRADRCANTQFTSLESSIQINDMRDEGMRRNLTLTRLPRNRTRSLNDDNVDDANHGTSTGA